MLATVSPREVPYPTMNNRVMGHASQLLDLHRSCLARFEAVILSQRLVGGRKTLSLFIEVPVYNEKRRRRRRIPNANRRAKDRKKRNYNSSSGHFRWVQYYA